MNLKGLTKQRGNKQAMQWCQKPKNVGMDTLNLLFHPQSYKSAQHMKDLGIWNYVSVNTLVNTLVRVHKFHLAEDMLCDQENGMSLASNINGMSKRLNVEA